jgi:hypothetical protein
MFIAQFDSRNFAFIALGESAEAAEAAMIKGLEVHSEKMNISPDWWTVDDFKIEDCPVGGCLLDYSLLSSPEMSALKDIVNKGVFSGEVLSVVDGLVTQRTNRDGTTAQHDLRVLSVPVAAWAW